MKIGLIDVDGHNFQNLALWCNNRRIFKAEPDFSKYSPKKWAAKEEVSEQIGLFGGTE